MKAPANESNNSYYLIPEGKHLAVLTQIIDLGTHTKEGKFWTKEQRQIRLNWELPNTLHEFKDWDGEKTAFKWQTYTFSMYNKAQLRAVVESIIWKSLSDEDADNFDFNTLLGKSCIMKIEHSDYQGKTYANIFSIVESDEVVKTTNPQLIFSIDEYSQAKFDSIAEWMQDLIKESPEYQNRNADGWNFETPAKKKIEEDAFDDLPF